MTGANRGIGRALVAEALRRGAKRVYAGTRQPLAHPDGRVTPLTLDVTNPARIQAAAGRVDALDLLINNAGIWLYDIPKASAESVARAIFDGVEAGEEDIFPDPMSASLADGWRDGVAKAFERQNAALAQAQPVTA